MTKVDQIACLHLGQAGIQIGSAFWELICIEQGIAPDGAPLLDDNMLGEYDNAGCLFDMGNHGKYIPRALFVDAEQTVIDEIKTGAFRELFHKGLMLHQAEDSANNYARGSYTVGRKMITNICDRIRKVAEHTNNLSTFFMFNSNGGGTGSGISPLVLLTLMKDYPKVARTSFTICPGNSQMSAIVEPYNMIFQNFAAVETADLNFFFENEAIFEICSKKLLFPSPTFTELNRILAMIVSSISSPIRFSTTLRSSVDDMLTNLIPYPRIHYAMTRYAPLSHVSRTPYERISTIELTKELFMKDNQSMKVDTNKGLFISVIIDYQGIVNVNDIYKAIEQQKTNSRDRFVEWSPTGFKVGICNQIPTLYPMNQMAATDQCATMLINSTAIVDYFNTQIRRFDLLFEKKSFVHWYINEGMEEIEFNEARDETDLLVGDLKEIGMSEQEITDFMDQESSKKSRNLSFRKPENNEEEADE